MPRALFAFLCLIAFASAARAEEAAERDRLAATVLERISYEGMPTCVMAAVVADSTRVVSICNVDGAPLPERDAIFEIGSLSKVFAGLALADMVRRKEVAISDPASKYSAPGAKLPARDARQPTLRNLVTHTASLPAMPPAIAPADFIRRSMSGDSRALYESLAAVEVERPIGGDVAYSNLGFVWLADIMGRRARMPYDRLLAQRVLAPLGMKDTGVVLTPAQLKRRVPGHDRAYHVLPALEFPPAFAAATGLSASMEDLLKLAAALAGRIETPLAESIALALTPLHNITLHSSMGYAWFIAMRPSGRVAFHDGQTPGTYAAIAVNVATRTAAVVLADSPAQLDDLAFHLVDPSTPLRPRPGPRPAPAPTEPAK